MNRILVTGASGQIGAELVLALRGIPEIEQVVAAGHSRPLPAEVAESGPTTRVDVTAAEDIRRAIQDFEIDTLYHMGSILSARAEQEPQLAFQINIQGLWNVLETSRALGLERVIIPSSIAAFGPDSPRNRTPNETIQRPNTIYGISKVFGELMGNYYSEKMGLDVRGVRLPGVGRVSLL